MVEVTHETGKDDKQIAKRIAAKISLVFKP